MYELDNKTSLRSFWTDPAIRMLREETKEVNEEVVVGREWSVNQGPFMNDVHTGEGRLPQSR